MHIDWLNGFVINAVVFVLFISPVIILPSIFILKKNILFMKYEEYRRSGIIKKLRPFDIFFDLFMVVYLFYKIPDKDETPGFYELEEIGALLKSIKFISILLKYSAVVAIIFLSVVIMTDHYPK